MTKSTFDTIDIFLIITFHGRSIFLNIDMFLKTNFIHVSEKLCHVCYRGCIADHNLSLL